MKRKEVIKAIKSLRVTKLFFQDDNKNNLEIENNWRNVTFYKDTEYFTLHFYVGENSGIIGEKNGWKDLSFFYKHVTKIDIREKTDFEKGLEHTNKVLREAKKARLLKKEQSKAKFLADMAI